MSEAREEFRRERGVNGRPSLISRWASLVTRHPKRILLAAFIGVIVFAGVAGTLGGGFNDSWELPGSESQKAYDLLEERFPQRAGSTATLVFESTAPGGINDPAARTEIEAVMADVLALPHVDSIDSPFDLGQQISADGRIAYATVNYDELSTEIPIKDADMLVDTVDAANSQTLRVEAGGEIVALTEQAFGGAAEIVGILAAIVILLIAFGSVVAMGLPIITALLGLLVGTLALGLVANVMNVPTFGPIFAAMIGIGVGIDYSLFIVTRFREGLAEGKTPKQATVRALDTSGRAVFFAGTVVVISMAGLSVVGVPFVTALGLAAALVVAAAVMVAFVFLPVFLVLIGKRIDKWSVHRPRAASHTPGVPFGRRLSNRIQARPGIYGILAAALLIVLALPITDIELGFPDAGDNPESFHSRQAYDLLTEGFGAGFSSPLVLVVEDPNGIQDEALAGLSSAAAAVEGVVQVDPAFVNEAGDTAVISVIPADGANNSATQDLVKTLRNSTIPTALDGSTAEAYVGGQTGSFLDFFDRMEERTPYVFVVIIGLSFLLLTVVFRSPVIALKAAIMNMLSISAAFGIVIAIFQWGWGAALFGVEEKQPIAVFMPMFLFAILFGLSMDYEVFLLSRIREYWAHGRKTSDAVADGLAVTARVITAAAAIMVAVFLSFVALPDQITKQFGLGLAIAIFLDATLVRLVLVPATMEVLGEWNWWFPRWLDRITPHVNIEGKGTAVPGELEPVPGSAD